MGWFSCSLVDQQYAAIQQSDTTIYQFGGDYQKQ